MASIDKIYGSNEQYDEFYAWCRQNKPHLCRYFYPRNGYMTTTDRPICNMPGWADDALWRACPLEFVRDRLAEQYGPWGPTPGKYRDNVAFEHEYEERRLLDALRMRMDRKPVYVRKSLRRAFWKRWIK